MNKSSMYFKRILLKIHFLEYQRLTDSVPLKIQCTVHKANYGSANNGSFLEITAMVFNSV